MFYKGVLLKFILYILLFFLFSSTLNASYLRSIRIGTFTTQESAQRSLTQLTEFVSKHKDLKELQKSSPFKLKYRNSGKYFVTIVEPFTNRATLQEVLDILRLKYPKAYVTSLSKLETPVKQTPTPLSSTENKKVLNSPLVQKLPPKEEPKKEAPKKEVKNELQIQKIQKAPATVSYQPKVEKVDKSKNIPVEEPQSESSFNIWTFLFIISLLLLTLLGIWFLKLKRENELYKEKNLIKEEEIKQISLSLQNNEKFLAHSTHELRTPMTAILGLTHLILENELPKFQREYIEKIQISAQHLVHIINDILDISKMEAGKLELEKVEFNINDTLDYVLNIVSMRANENNIKIKLDVEHGVPSKIIGDSLRLGQVLINLLGNAVKFTKEGEVTLNIKKMESFADTLTLEFIVSDTGIGMDEEQIQNAFSSYTQANASTSRKFGGTGLGLFISKQLVEMMNGKIQLTSQKGKGTIFTFNIPFQVKDPNNRRHYRLPSKELLNKSILIVDSCEYNTSALVKGFSYFNYECYVISSFEDAVFDEKMHFDIIVINQNRVSKIATTKIDDLKKRTDSEIKIVLLNELYSCINPALAQEIKVDAFIKIPFTQQSILSLIISLYASSNLKKNSSKQTMKHKLLELPIKRVLVAEDNLLNHKVITGLLKDTPIELTFVLDGQAAVELIKNEKHFDLLLMDINMPHLNGYDATKEIRKFKEYDSMPILALTADITEEAIDKAIESGMQGHLSKPIIADDFYKNIFQMLQNSNIFIKEPALKEIESSEKEDLSIAIGLKHCNNDEEFYKSILKDFKSLYLDSPQKLEGLCQNAQFKQAREIAMDIKDVALNIGAYNLGQSIASLEYELEKGSKGNWQELLSLYAKDLEKLLLDIQKYDKNV